jgi:hypothetical protein
MWIFDDVPIKQDHPMGVPYFRPPEDGSSHSYVNLRQNPDLIDDLPELRNSVHLREFVLALNSQSSPYQTFGCEKWITDWSHPQFPGFTIRSGSYADIAYANIARCSSPAVFQELVADLRQYSRENRVYDMMHVGFEIKPTVGPAGQWWTLDYYNFGIGKSEQEAEHWWAQGLDYIGKFLLQRA